MALSTTDRENDEKGWATMLNAMTRTTMIRIAIWLIPCAFTLPVQAQTCCDRAAVAKRACSHSCCVAEAKVNSICFKCNVGRTAMPFNGKDLDAWAVRGKQEMSRWTVGLARVSRDNPKVLEVEKGEGQMVNVATKHNKSLDIYSKAKFGDCRIELELMLAKDSNSGIYVMGEYEIQVLDSFAKKETTFRDMGGIYGAVPPRVNASKPSGEWQRYVIEFLAPRFDEHGNKTENGRFLKIVLNDQVIHENVELDGVCAGGLTGQESSTGPVMFQGDHGPVAYRNLRITDLSALP